MNAPKRTLIVLLVLILVTCGFSQAQEKRSITEKDLFQFQWAADPQLSPDGTQAVFTRVSVNDKGDNYDTAVWRVTVSSGVAQKLTSGPRDSGPRWSPDGKRIAFVRVPEKDGKPQPGQIYLLGMDGGEAWALTSLSKGAGAPVWSPDGKRIVFSSTTKPEDSEKKKPAEGKPEHESDVRVISRAVYRFNGAGYIDPKRPSHLWVVNVPAALDGSPLPVPLQLTKGQFSENNAMWSPDGTKVYYVSNHVPEAYYEGSRDNIFAVSSTGGNEELVFAMKGSINAPALSPDGSRFAFRGDLSEPVLSYTQPDLWVVENKAGATAKNLTAKLDYDIGSGPGGDQAPPRGGGGSRPIWSADGKSILEGALTEGNSNLYRFDAATGQATPITTGDHAVYAFSPSADRNTLVLGISTPTSVTDLYVQTGSSAPRKLYGVNDKLFAQLNLSAPEMIWYKSFDGKMIQTWVQKPPDFDPSKKYPLILNIHGGPHTAYGNTFDHEFQWMAAKGYVVLYPNPRGSTSYGQDFANIIQHRYPGDDFLDLMAGVDELIRRGYIDEKKLGVTGGSGGGVLTNWAIGHTDRFAAAVSQRSIADWSAWWYTDDFTLFQPSWFKGAPFEQKADFDARSPITYIEKVKTPLMLIEGEADFRTPPTSGGETMFRALKYRKIPTVMVRFPGESHELSRSGQPWHRIERLEHIVNWFEIYLKGAKIAGYDPVPESKTESSGGGGETE